MYQPPQFREERIEVMHDIVRAHPLATLVVLERGALSANHFPLVLHSELSRLGTLRGHVAKANPLWKEYDPSTEALCVFHGPQAYVTPSWYPSKREHGKVVPTWNYVVVHAHGKIGFFDDGTWLRNHLEALVSQHEGRRAVPWAVGDAPDDFVARQIKGIVGLEIEISRLEGKWKVSQNRNEADRLGARDGLQGEPDENARAVASLIAGGDP